MSEPVALLAPPPSTEDALATLQAHALQALRNGDRRQAALVLHRRAAIQVANGQPSSPDLAQAARLLEEHPGDRALVLLDLGHALLREGDTRRAAMVWQESARLAHQIHDYELLAAARHALGKLAADAGAFRHARDHLRASGVALMTDIERDFLTTLGSVGNLPTDEWAERERARRAAAVEAELAALKREMGLAGEESP